MSTSIRQNHRTRSDRRIMDLGPPGLIERRIRPERRCPEVRHLDFDEQIEVFSTERYSPNSASSECLPTEHPKQ